MSEKLKPCPFCGGKAHIEREGTPRQSTIYECGSCGCRLETGEEFNYGARWNERDDSELAYLRARLDKAEKDAASKQARIDELMLEYCHDEMTPEQINEWAKHQKPVIAAIAKERT